MVGTCEKCDNLDKSRKKWSDTKSSYQYGCRARGETGYICFWCRNDSELKTGGCSDFKHEELEQISLF